MTGRQEHVRPGQRRKNSPSSPENDTPRTVRRPGSTSGGYCSEPNRRGDRAARWLETASARWRYRTGGSTRAVRTCRPGSHPPPPTPPPPTPPPPFHTGAGTGAAATSARAVGMNTGARNRSEARATSRPCPDRTDERSQTCSTTARSCAMNRYVRPSRYACRNQVDDCAWIFTSRLDRFRPRRSNPGYRQCARDRKSVAVDRRKFRREARLDSGGPNSPTSRKLRHTCEESTPSAHAALAVRS